MKKHFLVALLFALLPLARASTVVGPWIPIFKGVDRCEGTNTPGGGGFPELQVVRAIRVDLNDPDIRLFSTPPITNYVADVRETAGLTVSGFLVTNRLQVAVNANFFDPGDYYLPAGTPMIVSGLAISEGRVVSTQDSSADASSIYFTTNNQPTLYFTNWPPQPTAGIFTAVSGTYPLLINGVNVGSNYIGDPGFIHQLNPRTAFGFSADRRYFYILVIDGRQAQTGYSDGAYDYETAAWLARVGARDGVNMDGGGSTTLVMQDTTGEAIPLNHSSAVANDPQGRERTVGSHFGIFARPLPGFINDVAALADDTGATISWTTLDPATSQVEYGATTNLGASTAVYPAATTNHSVLISGLSPGTGYYYRVISTENTNDHLSSLYFFVTTNYATTTSVLDLTNSWKFSSANLDGVNWTATNYSDSAWNPGGPALLWVDTRPSGPDPLVQPRNTALPVNPSTGQPYRTYYFRTGFSLANPSAGTSLQFTCFIDDGAVFYLNGRELHRVRMDPNAQIVNSTIALGTPCAGNATCPDEFPITATNLTSLLSTTNVLAVEVHNSSSASPDITFGAAVVAVQSYTLNPQLEIDADASGPLLKWTRGGFMLQEAENVEGPWADVPGPVVSSPYSPAVTSGAHFYRLIRP